LSAAVLGLSAVPAASAQQAGSTAAASPATSGDGQPGSQLAEIVVTASKRSATVLETPISITAIKGSDIQSRSGGDFNSLVQTVPGLATFDQGPGQTQLTIRGVDGSAGSSPTTGFYLGDTPLTAPAGANDGKVVIDPALYDLNRVEVLRGPQGTLYGASSMGGTVRLIPNDPKLSIFEANVEAIAAYTVGGGPDGTVNGMLNLPLASDKAALRLVGTQTHNSGWIDRVVIAPGAFPPETNGDTVRGNVPAAPVEKVYKDVNDENLTSGRVSLLLKPIDELAITPMAMYQYIHMGAPNIYDSVPGTFAHYQPFDIAEPYSDRFVLESLNVDYKSPLFDVVSNTSYWDRKSKQTRDTTEPVSTLFLPTTTVYGIGADAFTATDVTRQFSQEVRLSSIGHTRFTWIIGAFYSRFQSIGANAGGGEGITATGPTSSGQNFTSANLFSKYIPIHLQQHAVFGEISYEVVRNLRATIGGRYYDYTATQTNYSDGDFRGNVLTVAQIPTAHSTGFNPKYDLSYHPNPNLTIYTTAAKGFRPGGGNQTPPNVGVQAPRCRADLAALGLSAQPTQYDPDSLWSYELGEKARFLDGRVSLNADAYLEKWTQLQQTVTLECGTDFTANVGAARIPGGELEVAALVATGLQVSLSAGYSHGRLTEGTPQAGTYVGERIIDVPDFTAHAGLSYTRPLSDELNLISSIDYNYVSNRVESDRGLLIQMPAHSLTNLRLGVSKDRWDATLFANNLFNVHSQLGVTGNEFQVIPAFQNIVMNQPLTIGLDVSYRFH
jgi:outer membrane receptor protein involved in Fe transport